MRPSVPQTTPQDEEKNLYKVACPPSKFPLKLGNLPAHVNSMLKMTTLLQSCNPKWVCVSCHLTRVQQRVE